MKTVGRYEILREVGRGGMAIVYLARQSDLDRFVALKELGAFHASDASFAHRFLRESRVAGSLSHPSIVTVHDYFEHDGTPYIAMEYVERGSLRPWVGQTTLAQVGGALEGLLAGLAHAEQHGIVHRDLKPENLMVTADGRVKIADFGIAKATTRMQTGAFLTATGTTVGTPTYMAPEQAMAQDIGPWTDLYSVGCMAFELFTGRVPFHDSDAPMAILLRHVNEPIPSVKSIVPDVDERISDWIDALLIKDPKQRAQSANEAWEDFEEIVIGLLGPRWRREARLVGKVGQVDTPKPLTPAPFEGTTSDATPSDEFQSFAWGKPGQDTGGAAAAPPGPYTPPPQPQAPAPPEPEVGPSTPPPGPAAPAPEGGPESDFVTFGASAPPPPTDALVPPEAPPAEPAESVPGAAPAAGEPAPAEPVQPEAGPPADSPPPGTAPPGDVPHEPLPRDEKAFETYIAPPPPRPPTEEPPVEPAAAEPAAGAPPPASPPESAAAAAAPPEVPPTVMPEALRRRPAEEPPREESRSQRKVLPIVLVAGAVVAAVVGFLVGGSGGSDEPRTDGPPVVAAANADMSVKVPEGWVQGEAGSGIPALPLQSPVVYAPEGAAETDGVLFGLVPKASNNSTLLPNALLAELDGAPEDRESVRLGPAGLEAYRYSGVEVPGIDVATTLYAVPTTEGVATLACPDASASCAGIANTLEIASGDGFPVGPSKDYAKAIGAAAAALGKAVDRGNRAIDRAKTPSAQADAARDLRKAYGNAAKPLRGLELSPADQRANAQLVGALGAVAKAYGRAATAAGNNSKAGYRKASRSVQQAQQRLAGALEGLRAAGYEIES
jgi:hypothetical protein